MSSTDIVLGYWPVRGRSGLISILLAYLELSYTKKEYVDPNEWFAKDKQALKLDYPSLPYIIDGEKKVTDTNAIARYLPIRAGRRELLGNSDDERIQVEMTWCVVEDLRTNLFQLGWKSGDFEANKEAAFSEGIIKAKLEQLNKNLENKDWLIGSLSISDFHLFEGLNMINQMDSEVLNVYPNLLKFYQRFMDIPQIKEYLKSDQYNEVWLPLSANWSH